MKFINLNELKISLNLRRMFAFFTTRQLVNRQRFPKKLQNKTINNINLHNINHNIGHNIDYNIYYKNVNYDISANLFLIPNKNKHLINKNKHLINNQFIINKNQFLIKNKQKGCFNNIMSAIPYNFVCFALKPNNIFIKPQQISRNFNTSNNKDDDFIPLRIPMKNAIKSIDARANVKGTYSGPGHFERLQNKSENKSNKEMNPLYILETKNNKLKKWYNFDISNILNIVLNIVLNIILWIFYVIIAAVLFYICVILIFLIYGILFLLFLKIHEWVLKGIDDIYHAIYGDEKSKDNKKPDLFIDESKSKNKK